MEIRFSNEFVKVYAKTSKKIQLKFKERLALFCENQDHPYLKIHGLRGNWEGYYSFNVTADYRVIFEYENGEGILLITIGTHTQLYE